MDNNYMNGGNAPQPDGAMGGNGVFSNAGAGAPENMNQAPVNGFDNFNTGNVSGNPNGFDGFNTGNMNGNPNGFDSFNTGNVSGNSNGFDNFNTGYANSNPNPGFDNNQSYYGEQNPGYGYGQPGGYGDGNPGYQYPPQGGYEQELEPPMTVGEWLTSMLLLMIPCVGIVLVFVWAFSGNEKKSKANYFKAYLILLGIVMALYILVIIFIVALAAAGL